MKSKYGVNICSYEDVRAHSENQPRYLEVTVQVEGLFEVERLVEIREQQIPTPKTLDMTLDSL